jgi:hypothetical protein
MQIRRNEEIVRSRKQLNDQHVSSQPILSKMAGGRVNEEMYEDGSQWWKGNTSDKRRIAREGEVK